MTPSLRERRRRQTKLEIHDAALRSARERGFDNVTVEEISSAAGVSPRTFFNYFPNKESAIVYVPLDMSADLASDFIAAGPAPNPVVLAELIGLTATQFERNPPHRTDMADMLAIAHSSAAVTSAALTQFETLHQGLASVVAQRINVAPDDEVPVLIAALAIATVRAGLERWATQPVDGNDDSPAPYIQRAAALLQTFFTSDPEPAAAVRTRADRRG
ncbi:TetR family transcriptional regulator [Mycobacterium sp. pUA109]|uniref:TetR family transcriptional regulator n=1 Tax=Mycobacterium sp. pUA109 TaxID=3238982 RepID=UPI00351AE810